MRVLASARVERCLSKAGSVIAIEGAAQTRPISPRAIVAGSKKQQLFA
jgi:hypothetical protein